MRASRVKVLTLSLEREGLWEAGLIGGSNDVGWISRRWVRGKSKTQTLIKWRPISTGRPRSAKDQPLLKPLPYELYYDDVVVCSVAFTFHAVSSYRYVLYVQYVVHTVLLYSGTVWVSVVAPTCGVKR